MNENTELKRTLRRNPHGLFSRIRGRWLDVISFAVKSRRLWGVPWFRRFLLMGNTPAHHKRRLSGDESYRLAGAATPAYLSVTVPPSKRRNMHSMTDLSKSAPPDYPGEPDQPSPETMAELLYNDRVAIDEATSMLRAASLRDSMNHGPQLLTGTAASTAIPEHAKRELRKPRPASTGHRSPESVNMSDFVVDLRNETSSPFAITGRRAFRLSPRPMQDTEPKVPTVFRWNGGGTDIYISGTFNNWQKRIPMVKRESGVYVIIDCTPGKHEYKYFIDGAWYHDPTKPTVDNDLGTKNNVVHVKSSDFDVIQALQLDQANSRHRASSMDSGGPDSLGHSPPGDYGHFIPLDPSEVERRVDSFDYRSSYAIVPAIGSHIQPPLLPPHLLQGILNMDTGAHCDPNLLPPPNHVIVNHLYALSIKDGVIVLSVITRYRQKFVSTVFYKPIQD
ncbi:unnamed protein product [Dicrocoelium dendriticum]|nr:unnamed protein product [Dicrocoelium dendriticum]